jgi:hypothetical protein
MVLTIEIPQEDQLADKPVRMANSDKRVTLGRENREIT